MPGKGFSDAFDQTSKKDWLDAIIAEIGVTACKELDFRIDPDWSVSPFRHADDVGQTTLTRGSSSKLKWHIQEAFGVEPADHEILIDSLRGGCESILFDIGHSGLRNPAGLLQDVHLDLVRCTIESDHLEHLQHAAELLAAYSGNASLDPEKLRGGIRLMVHQGAEIPEHGTLVHYLAYLEGLFPAFEGICWVFPSAPYANGLSHSIITGFRHIFTFLNEVDDPEIRKKILARSVIRVMIGPDYFREIIRLRAIRLTWYNLLKSQGLEGSGDHLEVHFDPGRYTSDTEKNMIMAGTMAMAAILGGGDSICILPADGISTTRDMRLRRIARNIHHLLRYESYLEMHADPVRGASFFDSIVPQLVHKVWAACTR